MTPADARARAVAMREQAIRMARVLADARQPFGVRYSAAVVKEDAEDLAARFERYAAARDRRGA